MTIPGAAVPARASGVAVGALAWLLIGLGVGAGGAVLARVGPGSMSALPHYAAPYVLLLVVIGVRARAVRLAAVRAVACFVGFVVGYYAVAALQFGAIPLLYTGAWMLAAVTVCPLAAAAVRWARSSGGVPAVVVAATAGAAALSDGAVGNLVRLAAGRGDVAFVEPALAVADVLVAAAGVILLTRDARTRIWAVLLLLPCAVAATYIGWAAHFGPGPYL